MTIDHTGGRVTPTHTERVSAVDQKIRIRQHRAQSTVHRPVLNIGSDMRLLDVLLAAAADLQINRFLEAFHVTQLGRDTCRYNSLIFLLVGDVNI